MCYQLIASPDWNYGNSSQGLYSPHYIEPGVLGDLRYLVQIERSRPVNFTLTLLGQVTLLSREACEGHPARARTLEEHFLTKLAIHRVLPP